MKFIPGFVYRRKKQCSNCNIYKTYIEFSSKRTDCKDCQRNRDSIRLYGLSTEQIFALLKEQDGKCPICLIIIDNRKEAHVDHCHETGKVRGILCRNCNFALGLFNDNYKMLERAKDYILRFKTRIIINEEDLM